jgi:DNA-binding transcriptional LysR family regulator
MGRLTITQWERHIGRRLTLRDLFVFFTVVDCGSMGKAAAQLGVSTPSISALLGHLEHAIGVRLLDRTPKGVIPTLYGQAVLVRARAAFEELRQGIRDVEFLTDPTAGEVRIGCPESLAAYLASVIERANEKHPRMRFDVQVTSRTSDTEFPDLQARKVDLRLTRLNRAPERRRLGEMFDVELLFDDPFLVVVGERSKWARRHSVAIEDLLGEAWIVAPRDAAAGLFFNEAFAAKGLPSPQVIIETYSIHLRSILASTGKYVAVLPRSFLRSACPAYGLKALALRLSNKRAPIGAVTLRNRTLSPAVSSFLELAREIGKSYSKSAMH